MKTVIIVVIAILVIAGGAFALTRKSDNNKTTSSTTSSSSEQPQSTNSSSNSSTSSTDQNNASTITYGDNGFSPSSIKVKSGTTVTIKNGSSSLLQFDSNPHPDHTDNVELNVGTISPGQSKTFVVTRKGTFGYHNHLAAGDTGKITVE